MGRTFLAIHIKSELRVRQAICVSNLTIIFQCWVYSLHASQQCSTRLWSTKTSITKCNITHQYEITIFSYVAFQLGVRVDGHCHHNCYGDQSTPPNLTHISVNLKGTERTLGYWNENRRSADAPHNPKLVLPGMEVVHISNRGTYCWSSRKWREQYMRMKDDSVPTRSRKRRLWNL